MEQKKTIFEKFVVYAFSVSLNSWYENKFAGCLPTDRESGFNFEVRISDSIGACKI